MTDDDLERSIRETRRWLERAVIGLGLCPFAEQVYRSGRVRFAASAAETADALVAVLEHELIALASADPAHCETTVLIHPRVLADFSEFNDFLGVAEALVRALGLEGDIQVASFHPQYQFAGTKRDDIENCTNRSPHPTLHLLREASVARALAGMARPQSIYENNIRRMRALGAAGWRALWSEDST